MASAASRAAAASAPMYRLSRRVFRLRRLHPREGQVGADGDLPRHLDDAGEILGEARGVGLGRRRQVPARRQRLQCGHAHALAVDGVGAADGVSRDDQPAGTAGQAVVAVSDAGGEGRGRGRRAARRPGPPRRCPGTEGTGRSRGSRPGRLAGGLPGCPPASASIDPLRGPGGCRLAGFPAWPGAARPGAARPGRRRGRRGEARPVVSTRRSAPTTSSALLSARRSIRAPVTRRRSGVVASPTASQRPRTSRSAGP